MKKTLKQKGSVALISILIISAILIIMVIGISEASISTSYEFLNSESNQMSYQTGEACLEETLIRLEDDTSFSGATISIGDATCTSTVPSGNPKNINISVNYLDYTQNFQAQVSITTNGQANNASLLKWEKI